MACGSHRGSCRDRHGGAGHGGGQSQPQLTDQYTANPACFTTGGGSEYLELNLNGTWSTSLTFGASGLPAGGSYSDYVLYFADSTGVVTSSSPAPIPPGSSNGTGPFTVNSQTESVPVVIKASCKRKY